MRDLLKDLSDTAYTTVGSESIGQPHTQTQVGADVS
jgi:hypothetical protein